MPILESLEGRATWEVGRALYRAVPRALRRRRFRQFFGRGALTPQGIFGVVDPYEHPQPRAAGLRFLKRMQGRGPDLNIFGADEVLGVGTVRFVSYATAAFASLSTTGHALPIVLDHDATGQWNGTYICYGSADSNLKTYDVEHLPEQVLYRFPFGANGMRCWELQGRQFTAHGNVDAAIILRIRNPFFPAHTLFVCAGLSEWGSSGAAWYLFNRWESLRAAFGRKNFCCIVEVTIGADESARLIHSVSA